MNEGHGPDDESGRAERPGRDKCDGAALIQVPPARDPVIGDGDIGPGRGFRAPEATDGCLSDGHQRLDSLLPRSSAAPRALDRTRPLALPGPEPSAGDGSPGCASPTCIRPSMTMLASYRDEKLRVGRRHHAEETGMVIRRRSGDMVLPCAARALLAAWAATTHVGDATGKPMRIRGAGPRVRHASSRRDSARKAGRGIEADRHGGMLEWSSPNVGGGVRARRAGRRLT